MTRGDLHAFRIQFSIPRWVVMEIPRSQEHAVSSNGLTSQVALYPKMFTSGVCLSFYHPTQEVLHYLGMAPY